jgi:hypothetical protein
MCIFRSLVGGLAASAYADITILPLAILSHMYRSATMQFPSRLRRISIVQLNGSRDIVAIDFL